MPYDNTCEAIVVTKLTWTMDKATIERAKEYAQRKNKSVSMIVAEYLQRISATDLNTFSPDTSNLHSPITDSLAGFIPDDGRDYREMLDEARMERLRQKGYDLPPSQPGGNRA
jgi:hypothetical protein